MKIFLLLFLILFLSGCTKTPKKKNYPWDSSIIQYAMISCNKSIREVYDKKLKNEGKIWSNSKSMKYCNCSVNELRTMINHDEFLIKMREKKLGSELKKSGDVCKSLHGNWYEEK